MNPRTGWTQPPPGWDAPGWGPLVDPGPHPLQAARSVGRWLWPTLAVSGFLVVTGFVLANDDPHPGLSARGVLTVALAAAVVVLLTIHRRNGPGPLARAVTEYTVVALLATLLAAAGAGIDQQAAGPAKTKPPAEAAVGDDRPGVLQAGTTVVRAVTRAAKAVAGAVRWLIDLWRQADQQAKPANSEAIAAWPLSPPPTVLSIWRSP